MKPFVQERGRDLAHQTDVCGRANCTSSSARWAPVKVNGRSYQQSLGMKEAQHQNRFGRYRIEIRTLA